MNFCCDEQLGGIASIDFYLLTETSDWPDVVTYANAGQVSYNPEPVAIDGSIVPDSIAISDDPALSAQGKIWPIELQYTFMSRSRAMEQLLEQYAGRPGVAKANFNDGSCKLYGTNLEPLYMDWRNLYGETIIDKHGVVIKIKGDLSQRPVYL